MVDPVEVYAATLAEVRRQAAQLSGIHAAVDVGPGASSASDSSDWVVLESATAPAALPGAAGCSVWPPQQWQIAYELMFCQCPPAVARLRPHQADDLLFFVYTDEAAAAARTRLFVRRRQARAAALPPDLRPAQGGAGPGGGADAGALAARVDWRASLLLMVVLQTAYRLSLVAAADAELLNALLEDGGGGGGAGAGAGGAAAAATVGGGAVAGANACGLDSPAAIAARLHQVTKVVHASPSRVPVNLDHSRSDAGRPQASYPDICFAVDASDDAFHSQVLRLPADCYCVLLHADVASSWRLPAAQAASSSSGGGAGVSVAAADADAAAAGVAALGLSPPPPPSSSSAAGGSRPSSSDSLAGSMQQQPQPQSAVVFSGYVSHQQLTAALGSQLVGDPVQQMLRAAAAASRRPQPAGPGRGQQQREDPLATCRVSMRGPGGRGAADVAVSSFLPAADAGHLPGSASDLQQQQQQLAASPSASGSSSSGKPGLFERAQLLARGVAAAARAAAAQAAGAGAAADLDPGQLRLRCSLMSLQVPVEALAEGILRAL